MPEHDGNLVGTLLDGRYRVGPLLAYGGMSAVYRGTDLRLERPVAIKVMDRRYAADPAFLQRFEREARAAARLYHPGIVSVYDQGMDSLPGSGEHVFLVMELVDGATLRDLLHEYGRLSVPLALTVTDRVLSALAAAHRAGLVHRDIKPENVLIGSGGVVKVADFGLVRAAAQASGNTGDVILGTVAYLSPEQVATGAADHRSDVYATGVLLFEMLTGTPPYTGETALSVAYRHVNDDVPAPSSVVPAVPESLDELVVRATRRDPWARPADASAFLAALQQIRIELGIGPVLVPVPRSATAPVGANLRRGMPTRAMAAPGVRAVRAVPGSDHRNQHEHPHHHGPRGTRALTRATERPSPRGVKPADPQAPNRSADRLLDKDAYQRERTRDRRAFITWFVVVLLLASMVGLAGWWLGSGRWTAVPNLTGLQHAAVQAALAEADLNLTALADHHDTIPSGTVISSDPGSGNRALRGSAVIVWLSLGRPVVPDLPVGTPVKEAERALGVADLSPRNDPAAAEFHDTVPQGAVIGLRPPAGTVLTVGAPVTLVTSKGPAPTIVPEVRGMLEPAAIAALAQAGLTAQVQREFDQEVPGGQAISTDPRAGVETRRGMTITLLVSTALVVPDVVGQSREPALAALTKAGFVPQEHGAGAGQPGATVLALHPKPGSLVHPAENKITVRTATQVVVPDVVGLPVGRAREVLADAGLGSKVSSFFGGSASRVIGQSPGPGRSVRAGATIRLIAL